MNPLDDLINTMTVNYGVTFTIVIIATIMIIAIITILLPLFVWSIHNQTTRATKELIKLNKLIERLSPKQPSIEMLREEPSKNRKADEMIKEIYKENPKELSIKGRLPEQISRRRKVFYKPDDELPDHKKKTS